MNLYRAVAIAEGFGEGVGADETQQRDAWQFLIDTGDAFKLQRWYGRTAMRLIEQGICNKPEGAAVPA
jgi:hypothetical protein